jgi:hypothetical protein
LSDSPATRPGRNDRCLCGSGKKYKQCCLAKDEAADRESRAAAAEAAAESAPQPPAETAAAAATSSDHAKRAVPGRTAAQPWKRSGQNAQRSQKFNMPRKVGGGG